MASSRIAADEDINDYAGKTEEEINELIATKVIKETQLIDLEILTLLISNWNLLIN